MVTATGLEHFIIQSQGIWTTIVFCNKLNDTLHTSYFRGETKVHLS